MIGVSLGQTSSSMEEVAAKRPEEVRPLMLTNEPHETHPATLLASPPQSSLRDDSSSIEEERALTFKVRVQ